MPRTTLLSALAALVLLGFVVPGAVQAWVLQVPAGADAITLPQERVLCGPSPDGFVVDASRRHLRPRGDAQPGQSSVIKIAQHAALCATAAEDATLIVTGDHPSFDATSVTLSVDSGTLELRGTGLEGIRIGYSAGELSGSDVCLNVEMSAPPPAPAGTKDKARDKHDDARELCAINVDKHLPADPRNIVLHWAAAGGQVTPDMISFDRHGFPLTDDQTRLPITRVLVRHLFPQSRSVDLASGEGRVELEHPDAASSVECPNARCDLGPAGLIVSAVPASANTFVLRIRLAPRVFYVRGDANDTIATETLTVLRCPLSFVSGTPLSGIDELRVLMKLDSSCGADVDALRWTTNGDVSEVLAVDPQADGVYVLLYVGRIARDRVTVTAVRTTDGSVVSEASEHTAEVPPVTTSLALPGLGDIDFIPRNRDAMLTVSHLAGRGELVPISVPGAYTVERKDDGFHIRGLQTAGGFTALRFGYRVADVPAHFKDTDFGTMADAVQRPLRDASVPAPIGGSSITKHPVVELFCADDAGKLTFIPVGASEHIPFSQRESCRLVFHRERIALDAGEQRLDLEVAVATVSGADRGEAHLVQHMILRHGVDQDVVWVRGAKEQFDRISIHITHVIDASYTQDGGSDRELPSSQWTIITENANFRFYGTAAIPASLYRFSNDPGDLGTGPLSLNFGVLSRLTWLDSEGHEGLFGVEAGMMGMGLATDRERQLAIVTGVGVAIPLGNANQPTQAAVNIHAWLSYSIGKRTAPLLDDNNMVIREVELSHWAFVFGPSITVGSIGVFL